MVSSRHVSLCAIGGADFVVDRARSPNRTVAARGAQGDCSPSAYSRRFLYTGARLAILGCSVILTPMRFMLIDQIVQLEPDSHVTAVKCLSNAEEYLAEHFPGFPVMPGVLTLEAMTQAAAWLIRLSEDFAHSMIVLDGVRNVRYDRFVEPSHLLSVSAEIFRQDEQTTDLKAWGRVDGQTIVTGRLALRRYNLADTEPEAADTDRAIVEKLRRQFDLLGHRHLAMTK